MVCGGVRELRDRGMPAAAAFGGGGAGLGARAGAGAGADGFDEVAGFFDSFLHWQYELGY